MIRWPCVIAGTDKIIEMLGDVGDKSMSFSVDVSLESGRSFLHTKFTVPGLGSFMLAAIINDGEKALFLKFVVEDVGAVVDAVTKPVAPDGIAPDILAGVTGSFVS